MGSMLKIRFQYSVPGLPIVGDFVRIVPCLVLPSSRVLDGINKVARGLDRQPTVLMCFVLDVVFLLHFIRGHITDGAQWTLHVLFILGDILYIQGESVAERVSER